MNIDCNQILKSFLNELSKFDFLDYERLPDIDLYMDQVVKYLDRTLHVFEESSYEKQITSSMINNYVKGEVIDAPISKKYTKKHLATLEEVSTLKSVLSINEIKQILDIKYDTDDNSKVFNEFKNLFSKSLKDVSSQTNTMLEGVQTNDKLKLTDIALRHAIKACAYIQVSKRILYLLRHLDPEEDENNENEVE